MNIKIVYSFVIYFFFFNDTATTEIYTLSLHDALPIYRANPSSRDEGSGDSDRWRCSRRWHRTARQLRRGDLRGWVRRSEEHTSELQSPCNLVCRLLLEKKKNNIVYITDANIILISNLT